MLLAATAVLPACRGAYTNIIASQNADGPMPTWFYGLPTWHVDTTTVPASPAVPADASARTMVFGTPLTWIVYPVNPSSDFALNLTFLDDGGDRVLSLSAGMAVIAPSVSLPQKSIYSAVWNVSSTCVTRLTSGAYALVFTVTSTHGPNAIVSAFTLLSSNSSDPPLSPPLPQLPTHDLPRLTPRARTIDGADTTVLDLMGTWDFSASPTAALLAVLRGSAIPSRALAIDTSAWDNITVPGEYTLQGHRVPAGNAVVYHRGVTLPSSWEGLRVKLRCDGVYSEGTILVDGVVVGMHLGGFTPFELDVTDAMAPGVATHNVTIVVVSQTLADTLASATAYAAHDIGGITRKIYLIAVPTTSIAGVHIVTAFSGANYTEAVLMLNVSVANDAVDATSTPVNVDAQVAFNGDVKARGALAFPAGIPGGGVVVYRSVNLTVASPALWDPEHPNLHNLTLTLTGGTGVRSEAVDTRVGIRDVRIVGNRVVINGQPIKARGTTRHETHPLTGRSLWALEPAGKQWERDIIAFRDANINYIRTSHYPPAEELMDAADELGMLIELEMPFCWASHNTGEAAFNYTVQAQREAMVFNRNHPSVIAWSLGNESPWTSNFNASLALYLREVDSTRPFMFDGGDSQPVPPLDIVSVHYPDFSGPGRYANGSNPTLFGEYAHLNCYNRRELVTDPGVRDIWGLGIEHMWELIMGSPGTLGACYWAGIDDVFAMPGGEPVGYGEWGVIDAWRRQKPETFLVRQIYSPIKLTVPAPCSNWAPTLTVSNRHDFTDLAEIGFTWRIVETGASGIGDARGGPHTEGLVLSLRGLPAALNGTMEITAVSPRGFNVNVWSFPLSATPNTAAATTGGNIVQSPRVAPSVRILPDGRLFISDAAGTFSWFVTIPGSVAANTSTSAGGGDALSSGPTLMVLPVNDDGGTQLEEGMPPILPFNDVLGGWESPYRAYNIVGDAVVVTVHGAYPNASGTYVMAFDSDARLQITYSFTWTQSTAVTPRQIGLVFDLPPALSTLSWRRDAPWPAVYPDDHIGRPVGNSVPTGAGPVLPVNESRTGSWAQDPSPMGDADFRSTKHNVTTFELADAAGIQALAFVSNGTQHGRAWVTSSGSIGLLAADLSNEGGNPFSREKVLPQPVISQGSVIQGTVTLQLRRAA